MTIVDLIKKVLMILGLCSIIYFFFFRVTIIISPSMSPALQGSSAENGDWVVCQKWSYMFRDPKRWEIIQCIDETGMIVMKRVVGLPGEKISIVRRQLLIDGLPVERPQHLKDLVYYGYGKLAAGRSVECKNGYFVMGDDSKDSHDSRFVGPIERKEILSRALMVAWPFDRLQILP